MRAALLLLLLAATLTPQRLTSTPSRVVAAQFSRFPFDRWASENAKPQIKWEASLMPPRLSEHERLIAGVLAQIDGKEIDSRRQDGQLLLFVRIEDRRGNRWENVGRIELSTIKDSTKGFLIQYAFSAFVEPGDYTVSSAICDAKTMEHSFSRRTLHVAPMKPDPLPGADRDLPAVEFIPVDETPDSWYLPEIKTLLHLPIDGLRPARVELLVNTTASERFGRAVRGLPTHLRYVLSALKVLARLDPAGGSTSAAFLDLARQKVSYSEEDAHQLNWAAMSKAVLASGPGIIDVASLSKRAAMLEYFGGEVARRAGTTETPHAVIVLSAPTFFNQQEESPLPELPPDPGRKIYYIQYGNPPLPPGLLMPGMQMIGRVGRGLGGNPGDNPGGGRSSEDVLPPVNRGGGGSGAAFADDLERTLKPLGAKAFHIHTPQEFRNTIATIMDEIARL